MWVEIDEEFYNLERVDQVFKLYREDGFKKKYGINFCNFTKDYEPLYRFWFETIQERDEVYLKIKNILFPVEEIICK